METDYMTAKSKLPLYMPFPNFLLEMDITQTAKVTYSVLLNRALLSQENGWTDSRGRLYIIFPITAIASTIGRTQATVKNALFELENMGLIERCRQGQTLPNHIYVKLPDGEKFIQSEDKKLAPTGQENLTSDSRKILLSAGKKIGCLGDRKLAPNNLSKNNMNMSNISRVREGELVFGRYKNIYLSDEELSVLKAEFPSDLLEYIERLSEYMASTGKNYQNHAATIRRWIAEDKRKAVPPRYDSDYTVKEGETV